MSKERLAKIRITKESLLDSIGFPLGTEIKSCKECYPFDDCIEFIVSHHGLPEIESTEKIPLTTPIVKRINEWDWNVK